MEQRPGHGLETWAEAVLEVPFSPTLYQPTTVQAQHRLLPVQVFAQDYLRQEFPDVCHPDATPDDASILQIRQHIGDLSLQLLRDYVGMAHNMAEASERLRREAYEDLGLRARAEYQYATTKTILSDLQLVRVPAIAPKLPPIEQALQTGVVVVAPCGFGKTWVGAHAMAGAGVGRRLHADSPELVRGVVVVPSIDRLHEYAEEDEANIFRKIVGMDVPVGLYYGQEKNIQPITIITEASLRNIIENGTSPLGKTSMVLFDEVHHGTSPKNMSALKQISGALIGLTATPARSYMRDIRRHFPHVEVGSLRKFTELGILNSARLLTYKATEGEAGMEQAASTLAVQWLRQGRRVVVYAPRSDGQEQHYTDRIAAEINCQMGSEMVGAARSIMGDVAQQTVQDFRKKRLQGLVTVNMISIGSNVEADTLVVCGPVYSETSLMQRVGRAMRPTEKETILAEIWPHTVPNRQMITLAMLFGIENFRQGMLVGPNAEAQSRPVTPGRVREASDVAKPPVDPSELPPMTPEEIRSYYVGPNAEAAVAPPEGWLEGTDVMRRYNSTEEYVRQMLDEAKVCYRRRPTRPGVKRTYWYGPEALAYLDEHPPMEVAGDTFKTFEELSEMLDVPDWLVEHLCTSNEILREDKLVEQLAKQKCLSDESVNRLVDALYELPFAEHGKDVSVDSLMGVAGRVFINEYMRCFAAEPRILRFDEESDVQGYGYFLTQTQAEEAMEQYAVRDNREGLTSLKDIAKRTGNTLACIVSALEPEEAESVVSRRPPGQGVCRLQQYIPNEHAKIIMQREELVRLPINLVARPALAQFFAAPRSKIFAELARHSQPGHEHTGRFLGNRTVTTYVSWDMVRGAAQQLPLAEAFSNTGLDRLRRDRFEFADDEDMARADNLQARLLQSLLMPWYEQDTWYSIEEASLAMHCVRNVVDAFRSHSSVADNPELMRMSHRRKKMVVHFKALVPMFATVVAAPALSFSSGWRSHSSVVSRARVKGIDPKLVAFPTFTGNRSDMIVGREARNGRAADIFYDNRLAERVFRRASAAKAAADRKPRLSG